MGYFSITKNEIIVALIAWAASALIHATTFERLGHLPVPKRLTRMPNAISVDVVETPPEPKVEDIKDLVQKPAVAAPLPPRVKVTEKPPPAKIASPPEEKRDELPKIEETPADLSGVTLTNENGDSSWASRTGTGVPMQGPIGPPGQKTGKRVESNLSGVQSGSGTPEGPPVVAFSDLSSAPKPPDLDTVLERNYPPQARHQGVEGSAVIKGRIMPTGKAKFLTVVSESPKGNGFGAACRRTFDGSIWTSPRNKTGEIVATDITYTCKFEIKY